MVGLSGHARLVMMAGRPRMANLSVSERVWGAWLQKTAIDGDGEGVGVVKDSIVDGGTANSGDGAIEGWLLRQLT